LAAAIALTGSGESLAVRLCEAETPTPQREEGAADAHAVAGARLAGLEMREVGASCDIDEAVAFAVRRIGARARAKGVVVAADDGAGGAAACDRQVCRRVLSLLIEGAAMSAARNDAVLVLARSLRGAVLVQVVLQSAAAGSPSAEAFRSMVDQSGARELVEGVGGTLLVEALPNGARASVRLASAPLPMANETRRESCGVG
jgi:hypothetical protein